MRALVSSIKTTFYSYKSPGTFQVMKTNILPSPNAIVSALAKSLVYLDYLSYSPNIVDKVWSIVRACAASLEEHIVVNAVLLRVFRHDLFGRRRGRSTPVEAFYSAKDAMLRQFVLGRRYKVCLVINEEASRKLLGIGHVKKLVEALYAVSTLGDTESIVTVESVEVRDAKPVKGVKSVKTMFYVPEECVSQLISGSFIREMYIVKRSGRTPQVKPFLTPAKSVKRDLYLASTIEFVPSRSASVYFVDGVGHLVWW